MSSLIPERHLVVSPSLASTIGLEEAVLLAYLTEVSRHKPADKSKDYSWFELSANTLQAELGFWSNGDLQRICESLRDKGILLIASAPLTESQLIRFAFNQPANPATQKNTPAAAATAIKEPPVHSGNDLKPASRIAPHWQPDSSTMRLLAQQGVPQQFAEGQIATFVQYWLERGESRHAWGNRFFKQVVREWHKWQNQHNQKTDLEPWQSNRASEPTKMDSTWTPSDDALDILINQTGVARSFIQDAIPEFVLYWCEKGETSNTWNARFITHVKRQWARYQHTVENGVDPKPMCADWKPNQDVYDVLRLARIDLNFAREKIPEFVIYWRDRNEARASWNTTYLQFIKHQWQNAHESETNQPTRARRLIDDLTDTSWAD